MKKIDFTKLWVHFPKILFGLAGLLAIYLIFYGSQLKTINYRLDDVKQLYDSFVKGDVQQVQQVQSVDVVKQTNNQVPLDDAQKLKVDWSWIYRDEPYEGAQKYTEFSIKQRNLRTLDYVKPINPEYGAVINDVTNFNYTLKPHKCMLQSAKPTLFIAIISAPGNSEKRNVVRETWLQELLTVQWPQFTAAGAAFVIAQPEEHYEQTVILNEAKNHRDILQMNITDTFSNLSEKVASLFNWLHKNCKSIDYLLKVDDDVYVNPFNVAKFLGMEKPTRPTMYGTLIGNPPSREGKWAISYEEWPWNAYPRYITTAAVLISGSSIPPLLAAMQTTPFMRFDDIYLAGICQEKADVKVVTTTRMNERGSPEETDPCLIFNTVTWVTGGGERTRRWHSYTNDFYNKKTKCTVDGSTVNPAAPVDFLLIY